MFIRENEERWEERRVECHAWTHAQNKDHKVSTKKQKDTTVHWRGRQAIFLQSNMRSNAPSWWIGWGGAVGGPIMSSQRGSFPQILHSTSSKSNWFGLRRFGQRSNSINRNFYINIFLMSLTQSVVFLPKLLSANFGSDAILKILIDRVDNII